MNELDDAVARLESAVARLEAALQAMRGRTAEDGQTAAVVAAAIAAHLDTALDRLGRLLEAEE